MWFEIYSPGFVIHQKIYLRFMDYSDKMTYSIISITVRKVDYFHQGKKQFEIKHKSHLTKSEQFCLIFLPANTN